MPYDERSRPKRVSSRLAACSSLGATRRESGQNPQSHVRNRPGRSRSIDPGLAAWRLHLSQSPWRCCVQVTTVMMGFVERERGTVSLGAEGLVYDGPDAKGVRFTVENLRRWYDRRNQR